MYKYSDEDKAMLGFLVDNIYVVFGDKVFQQTVGIPMGTNCAPLLADLFLYSYEAEFAQKLFRDDKTTIAVYYNHTLHLDISMMFFRVLGNSYLINNTSRICSSTVSLK